VGDSAPLAHRLRPKTLAGVKGQTALTAVGSWFAQAIETGQAVSCIFWGPPGTGKTTLAILMSEAANLPFERLSAVAAGKAEVKQVINRAKGEGRTYLLFLDEIHRFNKAQQDVLLPYIEDGTLVLVGATTENPSFSLNNALLSRCRVVALQSLQATDVRDILVHALSYLQEKSQAFKVEAAGLDWLAQASDGDARYALNAMEALWIADEERCWDSQSVQQYWARQQAKYDRSGDYHYDQISALHKCVRDSDADAACYWLARMLEAGEEPLYIARRIIRVATEDIGLADPKALGICLEAQHMYEILGSPEGEQGLFEAVIYLALAPKSNAVYAAEKQARESAKQTHNLSVPMHLRNAPTKLMKEFGHGAGYQYAHDYTDAVVSQQHFPEGMRPPQFYRPSERGFEAQLAKRLQWLADRKKKKK